jgi:aminoglycoside 3-N-acetyltransferase I
MNKITKISKLAPDDVDSFTTLIHIFEDVFEIRKFQPPALNHLHAVLKQDCFHVFVARDNNHVIGGLTAYELTSYYTEGAYLYVYDLAVAREYQRQGIGTSLIAAVKDYFRGSHIEEIFVQAEAADDYAVDFYRSTGARSDNVVSFTYPGK